MRSPRYEDLQDKKTPHPDPMFSEANNSSKRRNTISVYPEMMPRLGNGGSSIGRKASTPKITSLSVYEQEWQRDLKGQVRWITQERHGEIPLSRFNALLQSIATIPHDRWRGNQVTSSYHPEWSGKDVVAEQKASLPPTEVEQPLPPADQMKQTLL